MTKMHDDPKNVVRGRIAVFIDAANLEQSVKRMTLPRELKGQEEERGWFVDYRRLKEYFTGLGHLAFIAFYSPDFGTDDHRKFMYFLAKGLRFRLNTKPLKLYNDNTDDHPHRKANFDVELAVDALVWFEQYDTFVLFSGDCDFEYLLKQLHGRGKTSLVFSRSGHMAHELIRAAHRHFDVADFRRQFLEIRDKKRRASPVRERPRS